MRKYDNQYYFIEQVSDDRSPSLVADENTEDRTYTYERQLVGTPPLVFYNGWKEENIAQRIKSTVSDILFNGSNLVVRSRIREKLLNYDIQNLHMHPTVYIHDDGKWHEDYWYMTFTEQFDCWDRQLSTYEPEPLEMGGYKLHSVYTYSLNEDLLDKTPLEQRLLFKMGGTQDGYIVCHQKLLSLFLGDGKNGAKLTPIHEY